MPLLLAVPLLAQSQEPPPATDENQPTAVLVAADEAGDLPREHQQWLDSVSPLITEEERQYFLSIREDYRREAFIDKFWEVRDPDPRTRFNELRFRWEEHLESRPTGLAFGDARVALYLLHGEPGRWALPDGREVGRCFARTRELEIWFYGGSDPTAHLPSGRRDDRWFLRFPVIMLKPGTKADYQFWRPGMNLDAVQRGRLPTTNIRALCADELLPYALGIIRNDPGYDSFLEDLVTPHNPSPEWLATFASVTTEVPADAETFDLIFEVDFPGRNQNRTAVQGVLGIPKDIAGVVDSDGGQFYNFAVVGEVLRDGELFELFRYRYELPVSDGDEPVPLVFTRYLRAGPVEFRIRVEDIVSRRFARVEVALDIPTAEGRESIRRKLDSPVFRLLAEASEAAARGERSLRLIPLPEGRVNVGYVRFETQAVGGFDRVAFFLDDQQILSKRRPPYSVELNLGSLPSTHRLRVVGYEGGHEVASDEIRVNQGGQRFRVHITEPRSDRSYESSVAAMVQVEVPEGQKVDRVEIFLDENRVATLFQAPYVQSLLLDGSQLAYVRAVAFLGDGSSTEDVQFINAPDYLEEIQIQYVELNALVLDSAGRPMLELERDDFRVFEGGREQEIRRFEYNRDLSIHAGLLIDTSASMADSLSAVRAAALEFTTSTIRDKDRICLLSFDTVPRIEVRFTSDVSAVERALQGFSAEGSTSLYDSLVYALTYFDGVRGQKALLLLSDGKDENSSFDFEAALEVAKRSGVIVYAIGLEEAAREKSARKVLKAIARETGGQAYFVEDLAELEDIYASIQEELRSRYLIAYQSTSTQDPSKFRVIRVEVDKRGSEVRTMSGYYP